MLLEFHKYDACSACQAFKPMFEKIVNILDEQYNSRKLTQLYFEEIDVKGDNFDISTVKGYNPNDRFTVPRLTMSSSTSNFEVFSSEKYGARSVSTVLTSISIQ